MEDDNITQYQIGMNSPVVRSSDALDELFKALSAAQAEITDPQKTKTAELVLKNGGKYSYRYADLADLLKIIRPIFAKHGLCLIQFPANPHRGAVTVVSRLGHMSGQWMESELTMPVADDRPQTLGSAITYARRYSAGGIAGLSPDEDEDGQVAQSAATPKTTKVTKVSHDPPLQQQDAGFDPYNPKHEKWLIKELTGRSIPKDDWENIADKLRGKPSSALAEILGEKA